MRRKRPQNRLVESTLKRQGAKQRRPSRAMPEGCAFHDMRHQAITELAEKGASDATIQALAGHMSPERVRHYSHVRMHAKREVIDQLSSRLMKPEAEVTKPASKAVN